MIHLSKDEWMIIRKAAKFTNGTRVPRAQEIQALKELQALVKAIESTSSRGVESDSAKEV